MGYVGVEAQCAASLQYASLSIHNRDDRVRAAALCKLNDPLNYTEIIPKKRAKTWVLGPLGVCQKKDRLNCTVIRSALPAAWADTAEIRPFASVLGLFSAVSWYIFFVLYPNFCGFCLFFAVKTAF